MTTEIPLGRSHLTRPYTTRSHTHTGPLVIGTRLVIGTKLNHWLRIRHENNVYTWFIQLYLQVDYDFFDGINV
jgi:hypothetical protein